MLNEWAYLQDSKAIYPDGNFTLNLSEFTNLHREPFTTIFFLDPRVSRLISQIKTNLVCEKRGSGPKDLNAQFQLIKCLSRDYLRASEPSHVIARDYGINF